MKTLTLTRDMQVRETTDAKREFTGLAVPWDTEIEYFDWWDGTEREAFQQGAVVDAEGAKIFWRHGEVIGRVIGHRDTDAGWEIDGHISDTSLGRDAYTLLRDGAITQLSIGFEPIEYTVREDDGVKVWTQVRAREVSLVPNPAYETATVSDVRHQTPTQKGRTPMDPEQIKALVREGITTAQTDLTEQITEMREGIAQLSRGHEPQAPAIPYRSFGEYVRAASRGEEAALELHKRAFEGATTGDAITLPQWIGDVIKLVEERRRTINSFSTAPLPAEGLRMEYGKLGSNSITVEEQTAEGADLAFGKLDLDTDSTEVRTYGGYTSRSRQEIERTTISTLDFQFQAFAIAYAKATEARVRTVAQEHLTAQLPSSPLSLSDPSDVFAWLDLVVDASDLFDDRGYAMEGLKVSKDVFKQLVRLVDGSGDPIFTVYGQGMNRVGDLDLTGLKGDLAHVPVTILPGAAAGTIAPYDHVALTTWESPGAPFQLQDENIVNLTKDYSVYGYLAAAVQHPGALVPVRTPAAPPAEG